MNSELRAAAQLVQSRAYDEARARLQEYVRQSPDQAYAWYLLSFAESDPFARLKAIHVAARLAPDNPRIKARLRQIQGKSGRSRLPILAGLLVVLAVIGAGVVFVSRPGERSAPVMPTLAELPTLTAALADISALAGAPSEMPDPTHTPPVESPDEATAVPTDVPPTLLPTSLPANVLPAATASLSAPASGEVVVPPPPPATNAADQPPAPTAIRDTPQPPTFTPVPPTPIPNAAPLNTPVNIGAGQMRVIAVTRPGDALVRELGGSAQPPPAGHKWVLVELLLVCAGAGNCAPEAASLRLLGHYSQVYAPGAGLVVEPLFGAGAFNGGQVWGYAGFVVPDSDTHLYLTLVQAGQEYIFALQ